MLQLQSGASGFGHEGSGSEQYLFSSRFKGAVSTMVEIPVKAMTTINVARCIEIRFVQV
jgi:hypothetical protein